MKIKIEEILLECGYFKYDFYINDNEHKIKFNFDNVFTNEVKAEAYIIITKDITAEKMKLCEEEILCFQNWYNKNDFLIYNITLLLIYDKSMINKELTNLIFKYERDATICRKIFINSDSETKELELDVLPFKPLKEIKFNGQQEELKNNILLILGNKEIYSELLRPYEELDIKKIKTTLLV